MACQRRVRLVAAQQHELRRDRSHYGTPVHVTVPEGDPRELLREVAQLDGNRTQGNGGRLRDSGRSA